MTVEIFDCWKWKAIKHCDNKISIAARASLHRPALCMQLFKSATSINAAHSIMQKVEIANLSSGTTWNVIIREHFWIHCHQISGLLIAKLSKPTEAITEVSFRFNVHVIGHTAHYMRRRSRSTSHMMWRQLTSLISSMREQQYRHAVDTMNSPVD